MAHPLTIRDHVNHPLNHTFTRLGDYNPYLQDICSTCGHYEETHNAKGLADYLGYATQSPQPAPLIPRCDNCRFYRNEQCQRYPPERREIKHHDRDGQWVYSEVVPVWPQVAANDWCGEHQLQKHLTEPPSKIL